jgi:hypothetical protein
LPIVGDWFVTEGAVAFFAWGGLLFDLLIVPLLLWKPTRTAAYVVCVLFHLTNALLFSIHVFPWFMIFATMAFFDPSWPRRVFGGARFVPQPSGPRTWASLSRRARFGVCALAVYCAFHVAWPLRHYAYAGDVSWTERGHYFAWHMMVRGKVSGVRFYVTNEETGHTSVADVRGVINGEQLSRMGRDPEMILHMAHWIAAHEERRLGSRVSVRALVLSSLNGRKPQLLIDPNVDLAREPRGFHPRPWIVPLTEPLRSEPWAVPLVEWERHLELPPRPFLQLAERGASGHQPGIHGD